MTSEQGLRSVGASASPFLLVPGPKGEILKHRVSARALCVLLPVCATAFIVHCRVHLCMPSGGWRVVGGGSRGDAGPFMVAAGLDLSRGGGCRGLVPSWPREVSGQWSQHLVRCPA